VKLLKRPFFFSILSCHRTVKINTFRSFPVKFRPENVGVDSEIVVHLAQEWDVGRTLQQVLESGQRLVRHVLVSFWKRAASRWQKQLEAAYWQKLIGSSSLKQLIGGNSLAAALAAANSQSLLAKLLESSLLADFIGSQILAATHWQDLFAAACSKQQLTSSCQPIGSR
jgi:hypothetical protein